MNDTVRFYTLHCIKNQLQENNRCKIELLSFLKHRDANASQSFVGLIKIRCYCLIVVNEGQPGTTSPSGCDIRETFDGMLSLYLVS